MSDWFANAVSNLALPFAPQIRDGSVLWMRKWQLIIGGTATGKGTDLSEFGFSFTVDRSMFLTPALAKITIYNPPSDLLTKMSKELTSLDFQAGYQPPSKQFGKVFSGPVAYYKHGRLNATDTFIEVTAVEQDPNVNGTVVNTSLDIQHSPTDVVQAAIDAMPGISKGQITDLGSSKSPRSRVLYGRPVDVIRDVAQTVGANAHIDSDGKLHILKDGESLDSQSGNVPILNSKSGMIDVPTQTLGGGLEVRSLLNPSIIPGGQIHVNEKDITSYTYDPASPGLGILVDTAFQLETLTMPIASDGMYVVVSVRHWGQNRGNPWYTDIVTAPKKPPEPQVRTSG